MIYKKDATFPYPVLSEGSYSYIDNTFDLDIDLKENNEEYKFNFDYKIQSEFIKNLILNKKAQLVLVVQSKDNKFFNVDSSSKEIKISKSRISLDKRTAIQLLIKSKENINFSSNGELSPFYQSFKNEIEVSKNGLLGFSNIIIFDGSTKNSFEIFEKKVDENLKSEIAIEIGEETIIISYKKEDYQFINNPRAKELNYPYIYMGLQKALYKMIIDIGQEDESFLVDDILHDVSPLYSKIINLLKSKFVDEVNINNIDEVIYMISDDIVSKYVNGIKGLSENGN